MIKTLAAQVKQYKLPSLLTPFFMALEVVVDILLPKTMGLLIRTFSAMADTCSCSPF